jgi:hypothetical protein
MGDKVNMHTSLASGDNLYLSPLALISVYKSLQTAMAPEDLLSLVFLIIPLIIIIDTDFTDLHRRYCPDY